MLDAKLTGQHSSVYQWYPDAECCLQATEFRDANIVDVTSYEELQAAVQEGKWARGPWAGGLQHMPSDRAKHQLLDWLPHATRCIVRLQAQTRMSLASNRRPLPPCAAYLLTSPLTFQDHAL